MKKFFRRFLRVLGVLLLLIIAAMIVIPILFKDEIAELVKKEANKNINGKLEFADYGLSLFRDFPNFSLRLDDFSLSGIDKFEGDTLASMKSLYASFDILSVLKGDEYKITAIKLDKAKILLKMLDDGSANWDIAKPSEDTASSQIEEPSEPSTLNIALNEIAISDAELIFDDRSTGTKVSLKGMDHKLKGNFTEDFTSLDTETEIEELTVGMGGLNYLNKAKLKIDADLDADLKNSVYTFKKNEIILNALAFGFDGYVSMNDNGIGMDLKLNAAKSEFKNFLSLVPGVYAKDFEDIETNGKLSFDGYAKGQYTETTLPSFGLNINIENAMFKYPDLPQSVNNINIITKISNKSGNPDNTIIDVQKFHVEMGENPVDIKMYVTTPLSDANIDGYVKGKINLAQVNQFYPLSEGEELNGTITTDLSLKGKMSSIEKEEYDKFKADGKIAISQMNYKSNDLPQGMVIEQAQMDASPQYFELVSFKSKIGKSDLQAKGRIDNILSYVFKGELLTGNFSATSNLLDLNEFMSEGTSTSSESTETSNTEMSVIEVPGNINFKFSTNIKKVLYSNLEMLDVAGSVELKDHTAYLHNLSFNTLDGKMVVDGSYSTKNIDIPKIDFGLKIYNLNIPKTFKTFVAFQKLAPVAEKTTGSFSSEMTYKCDLDKAMAPITNTMQGKGYIASSKIIIQDYKPMVALSEKLKMDKFKKLTMNKFKCRFEFSEGRVTVEPFDMGIPDVKSMFGGSTLFDGGMDYMLSMEIPRSKFGSQANQVVDGLFSEAKKNGVNVEPGENVLIDAKFLGTAIKPEIKLSVRSSNEDLGDQLKEQAKAELDKRKQELEQKAKDEADKLKAEADKKKQEAEAKAKAEAEKKKKEMERKAQEEKKKLEEEAKKKLKNKLKPPF